MKTSIFFALILSFAASVLCEDGKQSSPPTKVIGPDGKELSEQETQELLSTIGGLGVSVEFVADGVAVKRVFPDTPACGAGIKTGDIITHVDSKPLRGLKSQESVRLLRGPVDSAVTLTLSRK